MNRRHFQIESQEFEYFYMNECDAFKSIKQSVKEDISYILDEGQTNDVTVFFDPNFMHELMHYYHWRENHPNNFFEDSYAISGQVIDNPDNGNKILIARFLLKNVAAERSKTQVTTSPAGKKAYFRQNAIIEQCLKDSDYSFISKFGPLQVIGTGHSHPNLGGIGVNPSGIDVEDHARNMEYPDMPWFTHIVDPIRGLSSVYYGNKMITPRTVYLFYPGDDFIYEGHYLFKYKRKLPNKYPKYNKTIKTASGKEKSQFNTYNNDTDITLNELTDQQPDRQFSIVLPNDANTATDTENISTDGEATKKAVKKVKPILWPLNFFLQKE